MRARLRRSRVVLWVHGYQEDRVERADRWLRIVENAFLWFAITVLVVMALQVCLEVILRYFFSAPLLGMIQFSEIGLLYIAFLGAAWNLRRDQHVRIEVVYVLLPLRWRHFADISGALLGFFICLVLVIYGFHDNVVALPTRPLSTPRG